jgi:bifunctional DNA-binding transcriptional regulator/antitoxin component of YhaV-PrlF toxin-antitoxin module
MKQEPPLAVTVSTKGQMSLPVAISRRLALRPGAQLDIYSIDRETMRATVRRPSRILEFAGDLKGWHKKGTGE